MFIDFINENLFIIFIILINILLCWLEIKLVEVLEMLFLVCGYLNKRY